MKKIITLLFILLLPLCVVCGQPFSEEVTKYIEIQEPVIALRNITLIDGTGGPVRTNQDIVITGDHITAIGDSGKINIPPTAKVIDGSGKAVIPGLVMLHEHLFYAKPFEGAYKAVHMTNTFPKMYLAGGVTTMRTAGSIEANTDLNIKNLINQGKMVGPNIDVSTPHIERQGFIPQLQSLYGDESIENWINYWADKGVTSVKAYNNITKDDLERIIKAAHSRNMKVTGHLCSITYREAADLGIDNLEHGFAASSDFIPDKKENECDNGKIAQSLLNLNDNDPELKNLMEHLIKKNVTITYTPNVFEPFNEREIVPGGGDVAMAPFLLEQIKGIYDQYANSKYDSLEYKGFKNDMRRIRRFHTMGGKVVVGTDPTGAGRTIAGYSNQRLIELLIEGGFNIEEAIKLSTLNGANYLGVAEETGSVEVGKKADLILINGDLSKDVSNIRNMEIVFKNGVGFSSGKIFESVKGKLGLD
ncbi:Amidohydrolase family protein [Muriicola jejuensis]|uniref:Amidohydrolase family protein n=1 Tax=Muriicola jejuensis TaxID=504488 RepID=A0A6P0UGW4_9FLAO|nr:amidohydrolase family protein [Muriicola jejuensis]NER10413.1 amidohydrolase family protein [Muriicola jejuensis]SMP00911.1 Amidohydrolase family protein [Muriicola jejuensis]